MSNWNSILSKDNSKILGIINLSNDSFTGDGVFNHDEELNKLRPPVNGNEIMEILNIEPGPILGKIMESLYNQRINDGEVSKEEAIELAKKVYKDL